MFYFPLGWQTLGLAILFFLLNCEFILHRAVYPSIDSLTTNGLLVLLKSTLVMLRFAGLFYRTGTRLMVMLTKDFVD